MDVFFGRPCFGGNFIPFKLFLFKAIGRVFSVGDFLHFFVVGLRLVAGCGRLVFLRGVRAGKPGRYRRFVREQLRFQFADVLQFRQRRQVFQALQAEVIEEDLGGAEQRWPAGHIAVTDHADPLTLFQGLDGIAAHGDAAHGFDDHAFALEMLETEDVLIVPGSSFNVPERNFFRVTLLPEAPVLREVFARIERVLQRRADAAVAARRAAVA